MQKSLSNERCIHYCQNISDDVDIGEVNGAGGDGLRLIFVNDNN